MLEEDPFGDETKAKRTSPFRSVRFADQEPPSKKRRLGQTSDETRDGRMFAAPAASPEPPNALQKVIQAAAKTSLLPQPNDISNIDHPHIAATTPSSAVESSKQVVRIFCQLIREM